MSTALHYKDICLLPKYSSLTSRKEASTHVDFLGRKFRLPIIPSNMKCVIDDKRAEWLSDNNYFYIMHRFDDNLKFVRDYQHLNTRSISVGVQEADFKLIDIITEDELMTDSEYITIDIAHGHSALMKDMIKYIKKRLPYVNLIAGNVATPRGYADLVEWGADAVKVGIGGGSACSTKNKTGFTCPMYSCVKTIDEYRTHNGLETPIIADGGVREHADIVKAIHAGADMVMAGGLFSKLIDSPAEIVDGHKVYFGSASQYNKGAYRNVEGIKRTFEVDLMTYKDKLIEIEEDLQSAISYAGGSKLSDICHAEAIQVSHWDI